MTSEIYTQPELNYTDVNLISNLTHKEHFAAYCDCKLVCLPLPNKEYMLQDGILNVSLVFKLPT